MYEGGFDSGNDQMFDIMAEWRDDQMWQNIRTAAKTNNTLQAALDNVIMIYKLSKEYKDV